MCHTTSSSFFPEPGPVSAVTGVIEGFVHGSDDAEARIIVIPDIFGCGPFYQGLAAHLAAKGARVFLVDPFSRWGELTDTSREAAFARRAKLRDSTFLDELSAFATENRVTGILGFCLGGLYVFELARRGVSAELIGLYGFPQGLPNQDAIPVPFDYLETIEKPFTMFMGRDDTSVGSENLDRLATLAPSVPAMHLVMFDGVGHGYLAGLDEPATSVSGAAARETLRQCEVKLLR
jgi:carboxymethylenebutenolidase